MAFDTTGTIRYCGCDIHDGTLRVLFQENNLGTNISNATSITALEDALTAATPAAALSYSARHSIATEWEAGVEALQKKIGAQLNNPKIVLDPNFEAVYAALNAAPVVAKDRPDWEKQLGYMMQQYYEGLLWTLQCAKFETDDMLQEGFEEAVDKGIIRFRIVEKLGRSYNETVIEDGVLYLQTKPESWATNCGDISSEIVNVL
jgi:hypothetical protein